MAIRWEAASAVAIACAVIGMPVAAHERPLHMRIVVQDLATLSPPVITQAETVVTRIYSQIGVNIAWRNTRGFEEPTAIDQPADVVDAAFIVHVGLLSAEMKRRARPDRGTLGMTVSSTRLVRVFVDRVEVRGSRCPGRRGDVLGHVIAHEIGHILLGPNAHSTVGIMAAMLDLPRIALGGLWFDHGQAAIIRARLVSDGSVRVGSRGEA